MSYRQRRESNANGGAGEPGASTSYATGTDLNFAQRLLMANENTVTNIADLWVAAAMNVDNEDPFESEDEMQIEDHEDVFGATPADELDEADIFSSGQAPWGDRYSRRSSYGSPSRRTPMVGSPANLNARRMSNTMHPSMSGLEAGMHTPARRFSNAVAPIFSHVGVRTPPAVVEAQQLLALADEAEATGQEGLAPIMEGSRFTEAGDSTPETPAEPSLMSQLPLLIIFQYGALALHTTTHDQIFYLYLVS